VVEKWLLDDFYFIAETKNAPIGSIIGAVLVTTLVIRATSLKGLK